MLLYVDIAVILMRISVFTFACRRLRLDYKRCIVLLFRSIVMFDLAKFLPMLDQLVTGLNVNDTLKMIKQNKVAMKNLFTMSDQFIPSADYMLDHLHGEFSEEGSNRKTKEIDIFKHFTDYIEDIGFSGKRKDALHDYQLFI